MRHAGKLALVLSASLMGSMASGHLSRAVAQDLSEVRLDKSAAGDLYVKKRPPVPEAPKLPKILRKRLLKVEKKVDEKRVEAIGLLREFLDSDPTGDGRAEGLFKLAELLWEDTRHRYLASMESYDRALEKCRQDKEHCKKPKKEPTLSFAESEKLYRTILADHPGFRRTDLVLYLVGFASQEDGRREEALEFFAKVVQSYPTSPLYGESWLMIGEHFFSGGKWSEAREAYSQVLSRPDSESYDLALFKTAWCDWKLGDTVQAAKRFKLVLDLAAEADRSGTERERKRRSQLRDEALDYLVLVFTEDPNIKAADVFEFLSSIGGERYSKSVIVRLAEVFFTQGDYDRSVEAYRFLIEDNPSSVKAASYQRQIVDAYLEGLDRKKAMAEIKILVEDYKPGSPWAKENAQHKETVKRAYESSEVLVRTMAKGFHAEAQALERSQGQVDPQVYGQAADTYGFYLESFADHPRAAEVRFLHAEILFFKLKKLEEAGDEYLAVGKTSPVGKWHKDALLKAMAAFRKARPASIDRPSSASCYRPIENSPKPPTSTPRSSRPIQSWLASSTKTDSSSTTTPTTTRPSNASVSSSPSTPIIPTRARPAIESSMPSTRPRTTRTSKTGLASSEMPKAFNRPNSKIDSTGSLSNRSASRARSMPPPATM